MIDRITDLQRKLDEFEERLKKVEADTLELNKVIAKLSQRTNHLVRIGGN